jgi:hypothetical protein
LFLFWVPRSDLLAWVQLWLWFGSLEPPPSRQWLLVFVVVVGVLVSTVVCYLVSTLLRLGFPVFGRRGFAICYRFVDLVSFDVVHTPSGLL